MSDIRKFKVAQTGTFHLEDANGEPMYDEYDADGNPIESSAIKVILYGPGSKQFAKAAADQSNLMIDKLRAKGKAKQTPEQISRETAEYLAAITAGWENMHYGDGELSSHAMSVAIYSDREIGFIADQVAALHKDWSNFFKGSVTS